MDGDPRAWPRFGSVAPVILLSAGLFVGSSGCSGGDAPSTDAFPETGMSLFAGNCGGCHGLDGLGGIKAPALAGGAVLAAFPDVEDQIAVVTNGRANMPAFGGQLTVDQIEQVVDFTRDELVAVDEGGAGREPTTVAERPGRDLYGELCAFCHGIDGEGRSGPRVGGNATLGAYPDVDDEIAIVSDGIGTMPAFDSQLTADQIRTIVSYTRDELPG